MSTEIDTHISQGEYQLALHQCNLSDNLDLKNLLMIALNITEEKLEEKNNNLIKIKILCNWTSSEVQSRVWNKMSKGNFRWNNLQLVWGDEIPDYYVILNAPPKNEIFDKSKSIVFRMEPWMEKNDNWGEWSNPDSSQFLMYVPHSKEYNNLEWHINKTYTELINGVGTIEKKYSDCLSTILSPKYKDIGHIKRIDFVKFLESKNQSVHVYGDNKWNYKEYKGSLPYHQKDDGLFPYKYTFNAENNSIQNYLTEKLIDGILSECLVFYWGCPNVREVIDPRAYVELSLSNFEHDYQIIQRAIKEDWWSQRIEFIRAEKQKILNKLQFFPRVENIIKIHQDNSNNDEI
jgi:hypothetical protein